MPEDFKQYREVTSLLFKRIIDALNKKEGSLYYLQELGNFQQFYTAGQPYNFRTVYRKTFDLVTLNSGNIGAGATVTFAHGITGLANTALIYASCTSTASDFFTVVYPNAKMDATNLVFTNPLAGTALTQVSFVAEYMKQV